MNIKIIPVGYLKTNCYILTKNNKTIVIDPGDEGEKIINEIDGDIIGIIITHHHFDHVGALKTLKTKYNVPVIDYNNQLVLSPFNYHIIETKGHSDDSITIYFKEDKIMFCGDFIFKESIGRTDLPTGNMEEMKKSIKNILKYDEEIKVYPGHYENTTLKEEKGNLNNIIKFY